MYIVISLLLLLVSCEQKRAANVKTEKILKHTFWHSIAKESKSC